MKKLVLSFVILLTSISLSAQSDFTKQLWRNFNFGWDVYRTEDYRWRNLFIGTGYFYRFESLPKAYMYSGLNLNWSKYTIYKNGRIDLDFGANNAYLKTTSMSIPFYAGYDAFQINGFGMNFYTGPSFEIILASKLDGFSDFNNLNHFQVGWTVGSTLQFFYLFRARVAYSYYPMSLFTEKNKHMPRSAFTFSVGF